MMKIDNLTDRINVIRRGDCKPSHLHFDYKQNIITTINSFENKKLNIPYRALLENIIDSIDVLISKPKILKNDKYEVMELDIGDGDKIHIIDIEVPFEELSTGNYITCPQIQIDKIENGLRKELNLYKDSLEELLGIKHRNKPLSSTKSKKHPGFMTGKFVGQQFYIDKIIEFQLSIEKPLFLNAKEDKEKIAAFFSSNDIENFDKKGIQIKLGMPLEYAIYFFDGLKEKKVIVPNFQSYIDKSRSLFRENGGQYIDSLNMRTSLSSLKRIRKSNKSENVEVTIRENTNNIDTYIKRYFSTS